MDMLKIAALFVAGVVVVVLVIAASRPDTFRIERTLAMKAPPEKVFAHVADFKSWPEWSPWEHRDPNMKRTFSASTSGVGSSYAWEGNKQVGTGRMEFAEVNAPRELRIKLDFLKPFEAHNIAEFSFKPQGEQTVVNWSMHGPQPFLAKVMCLFMDMEKMVGPDFEAGLARLKAVSEKS
jgi:uncharacterized protein YndB with AHSA1/START domain